MAKFEVDHKKILLVDPQSGPHDPIVHLLSANDYTVTTTDSSEKAWGRINSDRPDLVLLETMLPTGTEGFHLVWRLREHTDLRLSQIPIVIVSGIHQTTSLNLFPNLRDGHYQAHEFLPVQGFIDKPVNHRLLLGTVSDLLATSIPKRSTG